MLFARLTSPLSQCIRSLWQLELGPGQVVLPGWIASDGQVEIVFHTGAPTRMRMFNSLEWQAQPQAFVLPMRRGTVQLATAGSDVIVALRVNPVVASFLLQRPMGELWDTMTPLRDLIGSQADALVEALGAATPAGRFEMIERWVQAKLGAWTNSSSELSAVHARLFWHGDGTPIGRVAREMGVSVRSLRRWTSETVGLSPKEIELTGRVLRACALLRAQPAMSITNVALDAGFYDQAAFTHAFSRQVSMPPSAFRALAIAHVETEHG